MKERQCRLLAIFSTEAPQSYEKMNRLIEAIIGAEGAKLNLNNPGDVENPQTGQIRRYSSWAEGFSDLRDQLERIASGQHSHIRPDMTLAQAGYIYSGGDPNWAKNVANRLGVPLTTPIGQLIH